MTDEDEHQRHPLSSPSPPVTVRHFSHGRLDTATSLTYLCGSLSASRGTFGVRTAGALGRQLCRILLRTLAVTRSWDAVVTARAPPPISHTTGHLLLENCNEQMTDFVQKFTAHLCTTVA